MDIRLTKTENEMFEAFVGLDSREAIAALLEIPYKRLTYLLYKLRPDSQYVEFEISKRSGGTRKICAPSSSIKILQSKLNQVLQVAYKRNYPQRSSVTGFCRGQSVVTNAQRHIGKSFVLNIDLEDFFPSIHFGRVQGMFMAKPYLLPKEAATALAAMCCYQGKLPQGAPSSPMVANMVCARLDSELGRLARKYGCTYSRYADDITFSSRNHHFPQQLARKRNKSDGLTIDVGNRLKKVVFENDFRINDDKVSLWTRRDRQEVTGLVVNKKVNVPRKFVRQIRGMLHAWEKFGEEAAQAEYRAKYSRKRVKPGAELPAFREVVRGKLGYLMMVRGKEDLLNRRLRGWYEELAGFPYPCLASMNLRTLAKVVWVVEGAYRIVRDKKGNDGVELVDMADSPDKLDMAQVEIVQGTAFCVNGMGLVTNDHVAMGAIDTYRLFSTKQRHKISARKRTGKGGSVGTPDLALLTIVAQPEKMPCLRVGDSESVEVGNTVHIVGYPKLGPGDLNPTVTTASVTNIRAESGVRWIYVDKTIFPGNSGGPVLNEKLEIIGVASRGSATGDAMNGIVPIDALSQLVAPCIDT